MTANQVIIDLDAIRHNFREIKKAAGAHSRIIAVVKSDAYGHGMIEVAKALETENPAYFGVFELDEALKLKAAGCKGPILIMMGVRQQEVATVVGTGFSVCLYQRETAQKLSEMALAAGVVVPVHIKVDTGMTRLGVTWTELPRFFDAVVAMKGIRVEGVFSHYAASDETDNPFTEKQQSRLISAIGKVGATSIPRGIIHFSNSAAVLRGEDSHFGLVRPGLALYGSSPCDRMERGGISLRRAMTFKSEIIQLRHVPAGTPISYGCTYITPSSATIATIPVGYDDGYNRLLSNAGEVLVHGQRVPVVGRVCMNLTMIDVSTIGEIYPGDEVVLMGRQGSDEITAEEIADKIGTISYEVYCSIGKSNSRRYLAG
jgi:alanine racemase